MRRKHRASTASDFDTLNLMQVSCFEMFTFCGVLHDGKPKTKTDSRECAERTGYHL